MQINPELNGRIALYALLGITELREMQWCIQRDLTPEVIYRHLAKGRRDLSEMAQYSSPKEPDPFGLAGTSRWDTQEADPDRPELPEGFGRVGF